MYNHLVGEDLDPALFKALGDGNRVALLKELSRMGGTATVSEAAACCPVDMSVVSRHLAILRGVGAVRAEKQGREVHYTVDHAALAAALRAAADTLEACCSGDCCSDEEEDGTR
jgi:ArsR family transcriptional regulator